MKIKLNIEIKVRSVMIIVNQKANTNISHQVFDHNITFLNLQRKKTNSKGDFVLKNRFDTFV